MFDYEKFSEWEDNTHIPHKIMDMVGFVCDKIGVYVEETTITLRNRGGYPYAYAKGISYSYCTCSYENGPDVNYCDELKKFLGGLGFKVENSFGDNGMDSATNWHDTYWTYEFIYEPSLVYWEEFEVYSDADDDYYE